MRKILILLFAVLLASCSSSQKQVDYYSNGLKLYEEGNYEEAILAFEEVIKIDDKNVDAYLKLAEAYVGAGEYDLSIETLQKGIEKVDDENIKNTLESFQEAFVPKRDISNLNKEYVIYKENMITGSELLEIFSSNFNEIKKTAACTVPEDGIEECNLVTEYGELVVGISESEGVYSLYLNIEDIYLSYTIMEDHWQINVGALTEGQFVFGNGNSITFLKLESNPSYDPPRVIGWNTKNNSLNSILISLNGLERNLQNGFGNILFVEEEYNSDIRSLLDMAKSRVEEQLSSVVWLSELFGINLNEYLNIDELTSMISETNIKAVKSNSTISNFEQQYNITTLELSKQLQESVKSLMNMNNCEANSVCQFSNSDGYIMSANMELVSRTLTAFDFYDENLFDWTIQHICSDDYYRFNYYDSKKDLNITVIVNYGNPSVVDVWFDSRDNLDLHFKLDEGYLKEVYLVDSDESINYHDFDETRNNSFFERAQEIMDSYPEIADELRKQHDLLGIVIEDYINFSDIYRLISEL